MMKKKVLVVDDEESIRKTFFLILSNNCHVFMAKNSKEAFYTLEKVKLDLIIADLKLPGISGLDMIAKFRESGFKGEVILISAYPEMIEKERLKFLAIKRVFVKPLDLREICKSVDCLLYSNN
ncbi:MAG: response regulator [Candidatus Aminicenantaceae bacterium]